MAELHGLLVCCMQESQIRAGTSPLQLELALDKMLLLPLLLMIGVQLQLQVLQVSVYRCIRF